MLNNNYEMSEDMMVQVNGGYYDLDVFECSEKENDFTNMIELLDFRQRNEAMAVDLKNCGFSAEEINAILNPTFQSVSI